MFQSPIKILKIIFGFPLVFLPVSYRNSATPAQQVLADRRLTPPEIAASVLPTRSRLDDWGSWGGDVDASAGRNPGAVFAQYDTAAGTVTSRYDLVEPGPRGFGRVEYTIEAEDRPRRVILVTVRF